MRYRRQSPAGGRNAAGRRFVFPPRRRSLQVITATVERADDFYRRLGDAETLGRAPCINPYGRRPPDCLSANGDASYLLKDIADL